MWSKLRPPRSTSTGAAFLFESGLLESTACHGPKPFYQRYSSNSTEKQDDNQETIAPCAHSSRIEADPNTGALRFYLNNALIGSHTPSDAAALVTSDTMKVAVVTWSVAANSAATRYVDDVRITPAQ